jgi:hypothetical protein
VLERALTSVGEAVGALATVAGLILLIGVAAHVLAWVLTRQRTVRWVWSYWNGLGMLLLLVGLGAIGYAWAVVGLQSSAGGALAGLGLLLLSAGLWMLIPV